MEFLRVPLALDPFGKQPRLGTPPAVVGEMRIGTLLTLDRDRQTLRRGVEIADPQDGVARLGQAFDSLERTRGLLDDAFLQLACAMWMRVAKF